MPTDLERHIQQTPLIDTHEHMSKEANYVERGPDILKDLFENYVTADLIVAGATQEAISRLLDSSDPDITARFEGIRQAWNCCRHTGYGEAVRLIAAHTYGIDEITPAALETTREMTMALRKPGERLRILKELGNYDHIQVDDFDWLCAPDTSGLDFFLYDLSWVSFCSGQVEAPEIHKAVNIEVNNLETLREAISAFFTKSAAIAIAVKTQHAYRRTLHWEERTDEEAAHVLEKVLVGHEVSEAERLCLGDWCWARGVEQAIEHNLPFKIHTGYYAGQGYMPVDRIRSGNLCALLMRYPKARFVLMHIAYPYNDELVALAKHFPNVYVDFCWAWSIDPYSASDFLRRMIHAVPSNKLFAFGGDTFWPNASVAYSIQARRWLTRALQAEVEAGWLTEREAISLATRYLRSNQETCFDIEGTRRAIATVANT